MNRIKSYQCAVFCSVSCHVIELPIAPHFINRKMIIATFYLLLSALKVGFRWILGRFKVGYYRKRRSPLGRFFWIFCELTPVCTLIPEHPQLAKFGWFWAELLQLKENYCFPKLVWLINLEKQFFCHFVFCHFHGQYSSESWYLGVFRNPQDLLLMMGTEILKINAEMAENIEVR